MTADELEAMAIDAHRRGDSWHRFWRTYAEDVIALDLGNRLPLQRRLMALCIEGDTCGITELPDGYGRPCDFELDAALALPLGLGSPETGFPPNRPSIPQT